MKPGSGTGLDMQEFEDFIAFVETQPTPPFGDWFDWLRVKGWTVGLWKRSLIEEQTLHSLYRGYQEIIWVKDMPDGVRNAIEFRKTVEGETARFSLTRFLINDLKHVEATRNLQVRTYGKRKREEKDRA